ncbi:MAG TPA: HAMP domain-containing sensor histidine kinase [Pyrinomonadaceae bacterium]|nr:HAMP domain-containing sensor histidine kinase [Pyrinomonadaceae bacterium]
MRKALTKFQKFLRDHVLLVGLAAVLIPLLSLLVLQYWSLSKLERTSTAADVVWRKNYLNDVSKEIKFFYRNSAEQVLNIPAASVENGVLLSNYPFGKCSAEGAKRLFMATFDGQGGAKIHFYDAYEHTRVDDPPADEVRAAHMLVAHLKILNEEGKPTSPELTFEDRDPSNLVALKPIVDNRARVIGAAGMIIDRGLFSNVHLPRIIRNTQPRFFPDEKQAAVIVTAYDEKGRVVFSTQPVRGPGDETSVHLPPYSDWRLAVSSSSLTPEQWAHWNFKLSLTLSVLMTLALLAAVFLALRAAQREIKLSQMKTDFVSNVSHELRTPLASIRVFGEFLRMGRVQEQETVRKYGEYIETESQRLTQLVGNILDFSRSESGRKTYDFGPANVSDLVRAAVKTLDVQLRQHGFSVTIKEPPRPLPAVFVDAAAITQALLNLLDNAVKYSGSSREIEVWLGQERNFVTVAVRDHGIGLSRKDQQKVFEKFYRVCRGLVHESRGSGLGLALVKQIVKAHRGRIVVESQLGRGSTFRMYLPVKEKLTEGTIGRGHDPPVGSGPVLQAGD